MIPSTPAKTAAGSYSWQILKPLNESVAQRTFLHFKMNKLIIYDNEGGMRMRRFSEFKRFLYKEFTPITKSLLLISAAVSLLILFFPPINYLLSLIPRTLIYQPWTLLTYPLVNNLSLSLVFAIIWFWYIGGVLERGWGSQSYGLFLVLVTLVTGGALSLVSAIFFQGRIAVSGLWIPLVGLTWAWAELHP